MTLSLRAYARHRSAKGLPGSSLMAVQRAIAGGRVHLTPDGTIDPAVADEEWSRNTDAAKRPPLNGVASNGNGHGANGPAITLVEAKIQEAVERARGLKYENDARAGQLLEASEVDRFLSRIIVQARGQFLGTASRLRMRRPDLSAADLEAVDVLIREVLTELADDAERARHDLTGGRDVERSPEVLGATATNGGGTRRSGRARAPAAGRGPRRARKGTRSRRASPAPSPPRAPGAGEGAEGSAPTVGCGDG